MSLFTWKKILYELNAVHMASSQKHHKEKGKVRENKNRGNGNDAQLDCVILCVCVCVSMYLSRIIQYFMQV